MNRRSTILAFCCLAVFVLASAPARALPPGPSEPTFCGYVCQNGDPCETCRVVSGGSTTCGQFWGRPANDLDGDGVGSNDNCQCVANANQANCDGDAYGDACDFQDNSWTRISVGTSRCYLDEDDHGYKTTLEFYYQDVYRSTCSGTCYKKYLRGAVDCSLGADLFSCCLAKWWDPDCGGAWNVDQCGLPRCSF